MKIPAVDAAASAAFYAEVFGWNIRGDGARPSFDDLDGTLSGSFETDQAVSESPGLLPFVYVDAIDDACARVVAAGGRIREEPYPEGGLWVATFYDPAGNVVGLWHAGDR